jgi:hypothetical protein
MSDSRPHGGRKLSLTTVLVLILTLAVSTAVIAAHDFPADVPDSNQFHGSISWLADNEITVGCNPPANDAFCPTDNVRRQNMAAFMRRFAQTFGAAGDQVTTTGSTVSINSTTGTQVASIEVTPKAEATVTLNAHVQVEVDVNVEGRFVVEIARGSCSGTVVGSGGWRAHQDSGAFPHDTISVTGFDVVSANTTYVLCVSKGAPGSADGTVYRRGLVGNWAPTA